MYTLPHVQGILYTTDDLIIVGNLSLTLDNCERSVCPDLNATLISNLLHIRLMSSLMPAMYGIVIIRDFLSSCNRAKKVTTYEEDLQKENEHLNHVFTNNGYPSAFIHSASERQPARKEETKNNGTSEVDPTQDDKKSRIITILPKPTSALFRVDEPESKVEFPKRK